jgi:hypothetical protein
MGIWANGSDGSTACPGTLKNASQLAWQITNALPFIMQTIYVRLSARFWAIWISNPRNQRVSGTTGPALSVMTVSTCDLHGIWKKPANIISAIEKPVDVDFEDQDASQWATSPDDVVSSEIIERDASYDGKTWAYKVTELAETGTGRLNYIPDISVSAGSYRFRFIGMNNFVRGPTDSLKWELVTIQIANSNGGYFYDGPVTDGIMLKSPWIQFEMKFDVSEDATAQITFLVNMTKYLRDWVFDDVVLERI